MKRIVSLLLAAVLALAPCMQGYATGDMQENAPAGSTTGQGNVTQISPSGEGNTGTGQTSGADSIGSTGGTSGVSLEQPASDEDTAQTQKTKSVEAAKGQVDVYLIQALNLKKEITFTVSLSGPGKESPEAKTCTLGNVLEDVVTFENLEAGTYSLTVTAKSFQPHTQKIEVAGQAHKLTYATGFLGGYDYSAGGRHPGVLLIGDVTGNGTVDEEDKNQIIQKIDSDKSSPEDLNGDGKVDLADLEIFTYGYQNDKDVDAAEETMVPASVISQAAGEKTSIENMESLSRGAGTATLKRTDGEPISKENPVSVDFLFAETQEVKTDGIVINSSEANPIETGLVKIFYVDPDTRQEASAEVSIAPKGVELLNVNERVTVEKDDYGNICINLGGQIAVKKVTLIINSMRNNNNLAEISRVEFVNGMEKRIPEPKRDIPANLSAVVGSKNFTVSWEKCSNVTGYEVRIVNGEKEDVIAAKGTSLAVKLFKNDELTNGEVYKVSVQSVNGAWRSGYSKEIDVVPKADKVPDAPDYVKAEGRYKAIDVSWKKMKDTDSYNVYYKKSDGTEYQKVGGIVANSYTISNLEDLVSYDVYVTGVNELGEGGKSKISTATTTDQKPAKMPKYKLLNAAEAGAVSSHIIGAARSTGSMQDSPLDPTNATAWGTVDNNPASHYFWETWDGGGFNSMGNRGVTYEFDQVYKMDRFALQEVSEQSQSYGYVQVRYWDANGKEQTVARDTIRVQRKRDSENRTYYMIRLPGPIEAKKLQFAIAREYVNGTISISEVYFYHYDSIEEEIMGLYQNDLHTELRSDVTQATIDGLRKRLGTADPVSQEYHPDKDYLERELKTAEDILNAKLTRTVEIHNTINTRDVGRGFGGLNAWQPLGVTAAAGEEITVYVGHNSRRTGDNTDLQLVSTQYHSEAASMFQVVKTLKVGRNDITIPKLWSQKAEAGGALYIQYTNSRADDRYAVRVSGGVQVPILDLYKVTDPAVRQSKAEAYISELAEYTAAIEKKHEEVHKNSENKLVKYDYKAQDCILGASDIMLDTMMLSLPAQQILAGCGNGSTGERAQKLVTSMDAMENMMNLFYQHKGLNNSAKEVKDQFPINHLNIRYQTMFAGAFMYASGNHIGIEWGSAPGMMQGVTVTADASGKYQSGGYYGWGIAHEIGHDINQGAYAVAEITNNYFSVLAQAKDTNDSVRFQYRNVYDKVTSGAKGRASNVFTQLGMYWQLHLAYDNGLNYKTYPDHEEQLANLFFARVDYYARTPEKAPKPGNIALTLSGDQDQVLMRLACAAAQKDILEFFERWGMTPNSETISYAGQFAKETRAIYYVNDESRVYRLNNTTSSLGTEGKVDAVGAGTTAAVDSNAANQVKLTLASTLSAEATLGYEIVRCTTSNGNVEKEVAGFTTDSTFTDTITTMNNRVVSYEVTVIDKHLNRSAVKKLEPLKISHKGNIDKTYWSVSTNNMDATSKLSAGSSGKDEYVPCGPLPEEPIKAAADQDSSTTYTGVAGENAEVVIELNQTVTAAGFQYTVSSGTPIKDYVISVRNDKYEWVEAASGTFGKSGTVYFGVGNTSNVALYQTSAIRLSIKNQKGAEIAISELDVLGVTGDDVEFRRAQGDGTSAIGRLKEAYKYGTKDGDVIPAGSVVFTGTYKGNSAYNVVILYDQDGKIVGGVKEDGALKAEQVVFTDKDETGGKLQDVFDGTWIYWISGTDTAALNNLKSVRAELYRVDNALTNQGQRLVSDCKFETMPATLPDITFTGQNN